MLGKKMKEKILKEFGCKCFYCNEKLETIAFDHVFPRIKGGGNKDNLVPCCNFCNSYKGISTIEEWKDKIKLEILKTEHKLKKFKQVQLKLLTLA